MMAKMSKEQTFDLLARENGLQIVDFETTGNIKIKIYTPKGVLNIDYKKWDKEENNDKTN